MQSGSLQDLRERVMQLVVTRPAETTPEAEWLVAELEKNKEVLLGIIDHLLTEKMDEPPS